MAGGGARWKGNLYDDSTTGDFQEYPFPDVLRRYLQGQEESFVPTLDLGPNYTNTLGNRPSQWDFMTGTASNRPNSPTGPGLIPPFGGQPARGGRGGPPIPGGGSGGGPPRMGGGGGGGIQANPTNPNLPPDFAVNPNDVNEYLAQRRGTNLAAARFWDPMADAAFQAASGAQAGVVSGNIVNPIRKVLETRMRATDPAWRRAYMVQTYGYDPQTGRMVAPQGFDPMADPDFIRYQIQVSAARRAAQQQALAQLYGPTAANAPNDLSFLGF